MTELLDIVDEYGKPTGLLVERERAHAEGIPHRTSHVWLLRVREGRTQVLLQKRSANKDSFPGLYDISSAGHIPAGSSFSESAVRELREELGIRIREKELLFCGDRTVIWDDEFRGVPYHDRQYSRVFALWKDLEESEFTLQTEEIESVRWMDLEECLAAVRAKTIPSCIFAGELEMVKKAVESAG